MGELAMKNHKYLPLKGMGKVPFRSPTPKCRKIHLQEVQPRSFVSALRRNDVDLRSNDVACKHANDVVSCGHK